MKLRHIFSLLFVLISYVLVAQTNTQTIRLQATVLDEETNVALNDVVVVNHRTRTGLFANQNGTFSLSLLPTDTLKISSRGYHLGIICLKDSTPNKTYELTIYLRKLTVQLREFEVIPLKSFDEIERQRQRVGYSPRYQIRGVNAFQSPISYLYERFSKIEQSKRKVAELQNEDLKRDILKDLLRIYIANDIIELEKEQFDAFIDFLNIPDHVLRSATDYELIQLIKNRYEVYKKHHDNNEYFVE
jgi:hypothetical protein